MGTPSRNIYGWNGAYGEGGVEREMGSWLDDGIGNSERKRVGLLCGCEV